MGPSWRAILVDCYQLSRRAVNEVRADAADVGGSLDCVTGSCADARLPMLGLEPAPAQSEPG